MSTVFVCSDCKQALRDSERVSGQGDGWYQGVLRQRWTDAAWQER